MDDIDIYDLASQVLGDITHSLNKGIYAELGGELTITWRTEKKFGAYASSLDEAGKPPMHRVTMYYELARQVWQDAEELCKFLRSIPHDSDVDKLYDFYGDRTKLPKCFNDKDLVNNIFVAAITWVYFHEIGHLMQEHGIIRDEFREGHSGTQKAADVYDFEASNHNRLVGREALVSHVTELAADFEATNLYILELLRHVNDPDFVESEERKEVLDGLIYLMVCGLSLLFLRFNGSQPILPTAVIEGSHPNPLIRLELNVPHIFETLDMTAELFDHGLDRKQLVLLCGKAALSATLFWSMSRTEKHEFDDRFLLKGLLSNSVVLQYLQPIVACWDKILPRVKEVRRFGPALGLMSFTDSFKERVASVITWGNGPEGKSATSQSPDVMA
ncbi:hypothetical protein PF66_06250 [Pseudomonas asplenii]|uniref:Peptidase U49 n=1 Tax=Pseudomonas asplenii TaxID=53407 RepID=A0A0M9GC15_9PSED|nr:hypothetical protein [Pseudomonas fuscovaginae]KPA87245.1 hypothetical protein PF66_06250 [Pseudomonas fuscovaginae]